MEATGALPLATTALIIIVGASAASGHTCFLDKKRLLAISLTYFLELETSTSCPSVDRGALFFTGLVLAARSSVERSPSMSTARP